MRKIVLLFFAVLFMTVPAMAVSTVEITCNVVKIDDANWVYVSYESDPCRIRAFGLDITVDTNKIRDVNALNANYRIYPGQIVVTSGKVTDYNTPCDPCTFVPDGNTKVTIEMGSLYTMDPCYSPGHMGVGYDSNLGYGMQPELSGQLLRFRVGGDCNYVVDVNVRRGGIVMEDLTEVSLDSPLCSGKVPPEEEKCIVPDVLDMDKDAAEAAITAAGLVPSGTGVNSCAEAANEVLTQDPAESTEVECGSTVNYTYSLYQTTVPSVVGGSKADADAAITAAGLVPNGTGVISCEPLNKVLTQDPAGSTVVACGSTVNYTYSLYQTTVPSVVGGSKAAADAAITAAGLVPVGTGVNSCVTLNQVLSQNPTGGTATCGTNVTYTYSLYQTIVPNVTNKTPDAAKADIVAAGLVADSNTCSATCGSVGDGNVVSTTPASGSTVTCGTSVSKVICECYCGQTDYAQWVTVGKPKCWCYPRQCKGDADGKPDGKNNYWVSSPDLSILKSAWQIPNGPVGAQGACADFDHKPDGKNNYRVSSPDLTILKSNWQIANGPPTGCQPGNRNP